VTVCACVDFEIYAGSVYVLRKDVTSSLLLWVLLPTNDFLGLLFEPEVFQCIS